MKRLMIGLATTVLVSGGLGLVGLGEGTAQAIPIGAVNGAGRLPPVPGRDAGVGATARRLERVPDYYTDTQSNFVGGRSWPRKATEHVPHDAGVSASPVDAATLLPTVGHDLQRPGGVRRPVSREPTRVGPSPSNDVVGHQDMIRPATGTSDGPNRSV